MHFNPGSFAPVLIIVKLFHSQLRPKQQKNNPEVFFFLQAMTGFYIE